MKKNNRFFYFLMAASVFLQLYSRVHASSTSHGPVLVADTEAVNLTYEKN